MGKKTSTHCDDPPQKFLDAAVAILLLCGFLHVSGIFVDRDAVELTLEIEKCKWNDEEEKEEEKHRFASS